MTEHSDPVTVARRGPSDSVLAVRMDRPPVNALGAPVRAGLLAAAEMASRDSTLSAVTLSGNAHCFSAGGDIDELAALAGAGRDAAASVHDEYLAVYEAWRRIPVPVVVAIRRYAFGGALELALQGDIRLCTPDATFSAAGVRMGLVESAHSLPGVIGPAAARMLFTADAIGAEQASAWGLVSDIAADVEDHAAAMADRIAANSAEAVRATKEVYRLATGSDIIGSDITASDITAADRTAAERAVALWRDLQQGEAHRTRARNFVAQRQKQARQQHADQQRDGEQRTAGDI